MAVFTETDCDDSKSSIFNVAVHTSAAACGKSALGIYAQSRPLDYTPNLHAVAVDESMIGKPGQIKTITAADVCMATLNMLDLASSKSVSVKTAI